MRNDLIRAILNCGVDDLSILDDSEADMFKIVEQMQFEGVELTLNGIMAEIFKEGIFRMDEAIKAEKKRLETEEYEGTLTEAGYEQLEAIRRHNLSPQPHCRTQRTPGPACTGPGVRLCAALTRTAWCFSCWQPAAALPRRPRP